MMVGEKKVSIKCPLTVGPLLYGLPEKWYTMGGPQIVSKPKT